MRRLLIDNPFSRRLRRSQRGQSILLMAFAFIALVAFVGLVTDVAMLFVRYAALRRAVDSAAIAAAGQIREGTDYANVAIAAQQYVELHNVDSDSVLVETCETDIYQWREGLGPWDGDPHPEWVAGFENVPDAMAETELCDWDDPRKLVRVSAQIESPTTFLSLIGIGSITLEATSVSETAVLDIALVIDTSESMSRETTPSDFTAVGVTYGGGLPTTIRSDCYTSEVDLDNGIPTLGRERWAGCCNDPGTGFVGDGEKQTNGVVVPNGLIWHDTNSNNMYDGPGEAGILKSDRQSSSLSDPNGFNFTTLVCAPFKDVRDAARLFIKQLDFIRGDRVVLVTFDRAGIAYDPDGEAVDFRPMIRDELVAVQTLDQKIGVWINPNDDQIFARCQIYNDIEATWQMWLNGELTVEPELRPMAYESLPPCANTNLGGGILAANNALTDPVDVRRDAVWVIIALSDGAANVTNPTGTDLSPGDYGFWGYCPWYTFCLLDDANPYHWDECTENNSSQVEFAEPFCNDNDPVSRHFCLDWATGEPEEGNIACGVAGHYDADDYAKDMADFAGLIEVDEISGRQGNFIAMFSIAFGDQAADEPTAAPLLRYIADAGDNGFIDNNLQTDLREDHNPIPTYPIGGPYPSDYGEPGPCEGVTDPREQCGQYYYASDLASLTEVFEEIAGRLFTRLSR